MTKRIAILLAVVAAAATQAPASDQSGRVRFAPGTSSTILRGTVRGYDAANYLLGARAGQRIDISLGASNASAYFNFWAPGAEEAMFIGSTSGSRYTAVLPADGDYRIQVYLMRNAARRNERANYRLSVAIR